MKHIFVVAFFLVSLFSFANFAQAATTPSLGAADPFSVLSYTFTNANISNGTSLFGDVGYTVFGGQPAYISGATHMNNATYLQAGTDQHIALSALNSQACTFTFSGAVDLATDISHGALGVYTPGVYCSPGNMSIGGGKTIELDGVGTFIFRPSGTLTTSNLSVVTAKNGASACDVFWTPKLAPPASAYTTLGSDTKFIGTVIQPIGPVNFDITVGGGTKWVGRALAYDWAVKTNPGIMKYVTITAPTCSVPDVPPPPLTSTLHVVKHVVNDNGGTTTASSFTLHVKGSTGMGIADVVGSPAAGAEAPGTSYVLKPAVYVVSEDVFLGYTATFGGDCDENGKVVLEKGDDKTCTITNDDVGKIVTPNDTSTTTTPTPSATSSTLRIIKHVINDNGGTATAYLFTMHVKSSSFFKTTDVAGSPAVGVEAPGTLYTLSSGTYKVSEDLSGGYTATFGGDCDENGKVVLEKGDDKTCTITNDDTKKNDTIPKLPNTGIISWFGSLWQGVVSIFNAAPEDMFNVTMLPSLQATEKNESPETRDSTVNNSQSSTPTESTRMVVHGETKKDTKNIGFPVRLQIPAIKVDTKFQYTGRKLDGEMEGPTGLADVGWFKESERPGERGDAVISGHVAQIRGGKVIKPGVFKDLNKLVVGDSIFVEDNRGVITTFVVRESRQYDPDTVATEVFTSNDGNHLNLITCDGVWNPSKKSYSKRLVVFADKEVE